MKITDIFNQKKDIAQSALAVPMALGPNDKFTPFKQALDQKNPDAVIWQADAIVDSFSKEVIWSQVKDGGAQAVEEREVSDMKKASLKNELDGAYQEFLSNWPVIHNQIVGELVENAIETAGDHLVLLAYLDKTAGGYGELSPVDQAYFLASALSAGKGRFAGVYLPETLDETLSDKVIDIAKKTDTPIIVTGQLYQADNQAIQNTFDQLAQKKGDIVNLQVNADVLAENDLADIELVLSDIVDNEKNPDLILTVTGQLTKEQIEAWLVFHTAMVTLALGENWQTPLFKSTVSEIGWG